MVKPIVHDVMFLMRRSTPATLSDIPHAQDLLDTLKAHAGECVGLAGNMIGVSKCIIVFYDGAVPMVMLNPRIVSHSAASYEAEEGCLSLDGTKKTRRYERIEVEYECMQLKKHKGTYTGFASQIIQHEIDHCNGILI